MPLVDGDDDDDDDDDDVHDVHDWRCLVQIKKIIDDAINIPDEDNDWMREQLRELAVINGTLRDSDTIRY